MSSLQRQKNKPAGHNFFSVFVGMVILLLWQQSLVAQPPFQNVAVAANLNITAGDTYYGFGASFVDFNGDGHDDITIGTQEGDSILFYQNNGNATFTKIPSMVGDTSLHRQILWVDIDNDNDLDLYVNAGIHVGPSQNRLYERTGNSLTDITATSGLAIQNDDSFGASFADIEDDGDLDLFISNKLGHPCALYRNNGNKTFTNITAASGISTAVTADFCSAFFDYDNDGDVDLYRIKDKYDTPNQLYQNNGNGVFTDVSAPTNTGIFIDAMNAGVADFNNDGFFDVYVTNSPNPPGNVLLYNNLGVSFPNWAPAAGVQVLQNCWSASFLDVDNDKDQDLYVCSENLGSGEKNRLFKNLGDETFETYYTGELPGDTLNSFANVVSDFNQDGKPDIFVCNSSNDKVLLWKNNVVNTNKHAKVGLLGSSSNKNAIGSRIEMYSGGTAQYRFMHCGINYLGQNSLTQHFGLAQDGVIDSLIVKWPSGMVNKHYNLGVNQKFMIIEGKCLDHTYSSGGNSAANKYIGADGNLNLAANWSKGHIPNANEDAVINNLLPTQLTVSNGLGQTINCRSLNMSGNILMTNLGSLNISKSYGVALTIGTGSTLINENEIFIDNPCGKSIEVSGNYTERGTTIIIKN